MNLKLTTTAITLAAATAASAVPLTGSGANLPVAGSTPPPAQGRNITSMSVTGWTAEWTAPVAAPWLGSFSVDGPVPAGVGPTGISRYDFSTMPGGVRRRLLPLRRRRRRLHHERDLHAPRLGYRRQPHHHTLA